MTIKVTALTLLLSLVVSSCVYVKYHDYADTSYHQSQMLIERLKYDTLIVVIPSYQDKLQLLKNIKARTREDKKAKKQKILTLYAERQTEQEAIMSGFASSFDFCAVLFIPDSLVHAMEMGADRPLFINEDQRLDSTIRYMSDDPIKLIKQFDQQWQIKIGNTMVPNPFPNYYIYRNGLYGHLGTERFHAMYVRVAGVFQRRFTQYYEDPDSRLTL